MQLKQSKEFKQELKLLKMIENKCSFYFMTNINQKESIHHQMDKLLNLFIDLKLKHH